jgi:AP-1 complex subunit beta-1
LLSTNVQSRSPFDNAVLTIRWGRVTLLEALSKYRSTDVKDAEHVCERVVPQFQHQNASVVMAAVKVVMLNLNNVSPDMQRSLIKKMGPPLGRIPLFSPPLMTVTMISSAPEVQYVALRNISLILQKQPDILSKEWRVFVPPHPFQGLKDSAAASTIQITSNTKN